MVERYPEINIETKVKYEGLFYLDTGMRTKIKIKFSWMANSNINDGTSWNITTFTNFITWILAE